MLQADSAIGLAVTLPLRIAESRIQLQGSSRVICGQQSGKGGSLRVLRVFLDKHHSTVDPFCHRCPGLSSSST
jgi:hypothetical protein